MRIIFNFQKKKAENKINKYHRRMEFNVYRLFRVVAVERVFTITNIREIL